MNDVDRNGLQEFLASQNVPAMIYYPVAAHQKKMFAEYNSAKVSLPVTEWLTDRVISLPIHTEMDEEQLTYITSKVLEYLQ